MYPVFVMMIYIYLKNMKIHGFVASHCKELVCKDSSLEGEY
jgi:hypothetical protein